MRLRSPSEPAHPDFLRAVTWVECAVVAGAAGLLYLLPKWGGQDVWAWQTPPFNARYVGAIYLGALVPLLILAITARWSPGRIDLVEQGPAARAALTLLAVAFGGYGLALIVVPDDATSFWPWPVDAFHARIYAATYLTPAVGTWVVRRAGSLAEYRTRGLTMVTFGIAAIAGVLLTDASVSATAFYAINALPVLIGAALLSAARASAPAATPA